MTTPQVQGITPPQVDAMITPRIQEVITRLNESTRQEMEVIMREMATPQMEELVMAAMASQRMDEVVMTAMSPQRMEEVAMKAMPPKQKEDLIKRIIRDLNPKRSEELKMAMATELESLDTWRRRKYATCAMLLVALIILWYT